MADNRLTRDTQNAMLGGVCAGIARHYHYDVTVVRVAWLLLTALSAGLGIVLYIATWIVMPPPGAPGATDDQAPDLGDEMLSVGERITESARVVARATREATEEIAEIARGRSSAAQSADSADAEQAGAVPTERPTVAAEPRTAPAPAPSEPDATPREEDAAATGSLEQDQERIPGDEPVQDEPTGEQPTPERRREDRDPPWGGPA